MQGYKEHESNVDEIMENTLNITAPFLKLVTAGESRKSEEVKEVQGLSTRISDNLKNTKQKVELPPFIISIQTVTDHFTIQLQ